MTPEAEPSPITEKPIADALDYWRRKCGGRAMPARSDIDPGEIKPLLSHVMLVDVLGPRSFRYRLIGTACVVAHGVNAAGLTLDEALKDFKYREHVIGLYALCAARRRPVYSESLFFSETSAAVERHVKVLFMPLSSDGTAVDMIFVAQIIRFIADAVRNQHFTTTRPHKEIVHAVL